MVQGQTLGGPSLVGSAKQWVRGVESGRAQSCTILDMSFFTSLPQSLYLYMGVPIPQPHPPVKEQGGWE